MTNLLRSALIALSVTAVSGCSDAPATPTSPSGADGSLTSTSEQLAGSWTLSALQPSGQPTQAAPAGVLYTLSFEKSRLSTRADCNTCAGAFTLAGNTLTVGPALACTRAACATMAFEAAYAAILAGTHAVTITGNTLVLSSSAGRLSFTR